jgi:hypothetical protein
MDQAPLHRLEKKKIFLKHFIYQVTHKREDSLSLAAEAK